MATHPYQLRRTRSVEARNILWESLGQKQVQGLQFYRQQRLSGITVDFYCPQVQLVIEVYGNHREFNSSVIRTRGLEARGLRIVRFDGTLVMHQLLAVLSHIELAVAWQMRDRIDEPLDVKRTT